LSAWETFRRGPTSHNECSNHWWTQFCLDFHWFQAECHRISSWRILVSSKYSFRMLWDALGCCGNVIPYIPWCWQPWNNPWGARSKLELRWSQQRVGRGTTGTMGTTGTKSILDFFLWLDMWLIDPILGVQYIAIPYVDCQIANSDILIDWLWYHDARKNMRLKNCCSKLEVECCEVVMCCVDHKILFRIEKSTKRVASLSRCSRRTTHQAMTRSVTN
jgi:hypothetical protein